MALVKGIGRTMDAKVRQSISAVFASDLNYTLLASILETS